MQRLSPLILTFLLLSACAAPSELPVVKNVHTVVPGSLIRGGQPDAAGFAALQQIYNIRTVVNLSDDTAATEAATVEALGMNYVALPTDATDIDPANLLAFLRIMQAPDAHAPVFVHCKAGMDRTGAAVAAFRIIEQDWPIDRALDELADHQAPGHRLFFRNIPRTLRHVEQHREAWSASAEVRLNADTAE